MSSRIYLDSSALVKLAIAELESAALARYLASVAEAATSTVAGIEVVRVVAAIDPSADARSRAKDVVDRCFEIDLSNDVKRLAALVQPPSLKSLDAIHLASAFSVRDALDAFVTYDRRLGQAARAAGLRVVAPGQPAAGT